MKVIPFVRFLFVIVLIYNLLSASPDGVPSLVIILYAILEFGFLLFQILEAIKELQGKLIEVNMLRLYAILYNLLTLIGYSFMMFFLESLDLFGVLFFIMVLVSIFILLVDVRKYFSELNAS